MSQIVYQTEDREGRSVEVMTGWDRQLQYHFLNVSRLDDEGEDIELLYTNLDRESPGMSTDEIRTELEERDIPLPSNLIARLEEDRRENRGNRIVNMGEI